MGPPSNFFRIILQDAQGMWTLTDLPLSATLEEYMMGAWNHLSFSMQASGWSVTLDGEAIADSAYGIYGHHGYFNAENNANPNPSRANTAWSPMLGFGTTPLYLGARICSQPGCARNEWLGYLADFTVYEDALAADCAIPLYQDMVTFMPSGVPHAVIEGSCSDVANYPKEVESTLMAGDGSMPTLGGQTQITQFGLHFDGQNDWAEMNTPAYGDDASWTFSIWFSKSECNSNAAWNWEYMIAHSASGDSAANLDGTGAPGGDDNVHIYLGCRPDVTDQGWSFVSPQPILQLLVMSGSFLRDCL